MIIMALDHTRDYFHANAFLYDPLDLQKTTVLRIVRFFIEERALADHSGRDHRKFWMVLQPSF